jgi:glutathione S-transferase
VLTLFSYPDLFGLPDNNPYGLKTCAFLKLVGLPFRHEHIVDASHAPHAQLPYITDGEVTLGDSDTIIAYLIETYALAIDNALTEADRTTHLLIRRTLDDLYWVMSYSRWKDDRFWPLFRDALLRTHPTISADALEGARAFNSKRYYYQGIGRYTPDEAYARGCADLDALAKLVPPSGFVLGPTPTSIDAAIYGFTANIRFYEIDTPLKQRLLTHPALVTHCDATHAIVG